jgi:hypothetical protein
MIHITSIPITRLGSSGIHPAHTEKNKGSRTKERERKRDEVRDEREEMDMSELSISGSDQNVCFPWQRKR